MGLSKFKNNLDSLMYYCDSFYYLAKLYHLIFESFCIYYPFLHLSFTNYHSTKLLLLGLLANLEYFYPCFFILILTYYLFSLVHLYMIMNGLSDLLWDLHLLWEFKFDELLSSFSSGLFFFIKFCPVIKLLANYWRDPSLLWMIWLL